MVDNTLWFVVALVLVVIFLIIGAWMFYLQKQVNDILKKTEDNEDKDRA